MAALAAPAFAQSHPETRLQVIGNLAGVTQYTKFEEPFWTRRVTEASGGAVTAEIAPYDRSGIGARGALPLIRLGVATLATASLAGMSTEEPEVNASDLPGLSPDIAAYRAKLAAYRPRLKQLLAERHGVELLAIYVYPAQVIFCRRPFASLDDLKGRRIRTSSVSQSDLVQDLGGVPIVIEFKALVASMTAGSIDCAITGGVSGNLIGLQEVASHMSTLAITWGPSAFMANKAYWDGLPSEIRAFLVRELAGLEAAIWAEAERETLLGAACNSGRGACPNGRPGRMTIVDPTERDIARVSESLRNTVLPRWLRRCGAECEESWNETLATITGLRASP